MSDVLIWALLLSVAAILYVYAGYVVLLRLFVRIFGERVVHIGPVTPSVTLLISAYNEVGVIRKKLENALALDYPRDLLEIVVVSDASDDGTDEVVKGYASRGVRLFRQAERRGKTEGLNAVMPTVRTMSPTTMRANAAAANRGAASRVCQMRGNAW